MPHIVFFLSTVECPECVL